MDQNEKQALEGRVSGRVAAMRAMFNKGADASASPPPPRPAPRTHSVARMGGYTGSSNAPFLSSGDTVENSVLRKMRERREAEKKAEEDALLASRSVTSTQTLVDKAADEQKQRETEDRRIAQASKDMYASTSTNSLDDPVYQHNQKQKEYERSAEKEAKESLLQFARNGDHDHVYTHAVKSKESELKAEREAKESMRKFSGGKSFFEEKLEEKRRLEEAERQKVQDTIHGFARNNFSSPDFDPAYVRAKELEQLEKEAEEKAKASLLQFSQHDVSHEMVMKNGFMVRKTSTDSDTSSTSTTSPPATSYPFTDKSRKIAPSPAAVKAVARFQQQLAASRAREDEKAERKASIDLARKASFELSRKTSCESLPRSEPDLEQIKGSVDATSVSVKSAAQKFKDMERKAAAERAKAASAFPRKNSASSNDGAGLSLFELHARNMKRQQEQTKAKEQHTKERMAHGAPTGLSRVAMVVRIQRIVRGKLARRRYVQRTEAAKTLAVFAQSHFRRQVAQKQVAELRHELALRVAGIVRIQTLLRGVIQRRRYRAQVAAAVVLQSAVRARHAQRTYASTMRAVALIHAFARRARAARDTRAQLQRLQLERNEKVAAVTSIQTAFRTHRAQRAFNAQVRAVVRLQSHWRRALATKQLAMLKAEAEVQHWIRQDLEHASAVKLQTQWRSRQARAVVAELKMQALARRAERENRVALLIQARWRGAAARARVAALKQQVQRAQLEHAMAVTLQSAWRGVVARAEVSIRKAEAQLREQERQIELANVMARRVQGVWRIKVARARLLQMKSEHAEHQAAVESLMALRIQSHWRGATDRARVIELQHEREAMKQKAQAELENAMAVKLQSAWRGVSARSTVSELKSAKQLEAEAAASAAERQAELAREAAREAARQAELENAMAVKLQSAWRGVSARSTVSELKSAKQLEAEAAASAAERQAELAREAAREAARQADLESVRQVAFDRESERDGGRRTDGSGSAPARPTLEELEKLSSLGRFSEFFSDNSDDDSDDDDDEDDSDDDGNDDNDDNDSYASFNGVSNDDNDSYASFGGVVNDDNDSFASFSGVSMSPTSAMDSANEFAHSDDTNSEGDDDRVSDSDTSEVALPPQVAAVAVECEGVDNQTPLPVATMTIEHDDEDNQTLSSASDKVADAYSSATETAPSSTVSSVVSFASPPVSSNDVVSAAPNKRTSDATSDFARASSPFAPTFGRESFDSGTPRSSAMSAAAARESIGQLLFEAINTETKVPVETAAAHDEPQYFDTDSERESVGERDAFSSNNNNDDDDDDVLDARHTYVKDDAPKSSGGRRWGRPKLLNKLATDKLAHVFEKKSSSSKASSSNSNSSSLEDAAEVSNADGDSEPRTKTKKLAFGSVAATLARKATAATTRTFAIDQSTPVPSNRLRKASSAASAASMGSDTLESVVYSPSPDEPKPKTKFGSFFRAPSSSSAAPAAPPAQQTASKPTPTTGFAKRFGWKKASAAAADKNKKQSGQNADSDDDDHASLSIAA